MVGSGSARDNHEVATEGFMGMFIESSRSQEAAFDCESGRAKAPRVPPDLETS